MSLATEARRILERLPPGARETLESTASFVPRPLLYGATYRATLRSLAASERMPAEALQAAQDVRVRDLVAWAYERVPYYRRVMDERGVRPTHVTRARDLALLPLIDRRTVIECGEEMLARGVPAAAREIVKTTGTTGEPLRLWIDRGRSAREWAFMTWQWGRVGYRPGARRAVLRSTHVRDQARGRLHEWHPLLDELILSTHRLSATTLPHYVDLLSRFRPEFLHAYPSSAETLGRLLGAVPASRRPRFRAVLVGSENLYPSQRAWLERTFGCPVLAWYGHTEKCLIGAGCDRSNDYHMIPEYGVLEVLDERGNAVEPGKSGTIVGTGFLNHAMPFLRYVTDDRGTVAPDSAAQPGEARSACACGCAYPRLTAIEGRWLGDRLFGVHGEVFAMTAIDSHSSAFDRVARYRVRQERAGEASILVVPGPGFAAEECVSIAAAFDKSAAGAIRFDVEIVPELPLSGRAKFMLVEQLIPEAVQQALMKGPDEVA